MKIHRRKNEIKIRMRRKSILSVIEIGKNTCNWKKNIVGANKQKKLTKFPDQDAAENENELTNEKNVYKA